MSSNKYYLRVANSWLKLFSPSGNRRYMANTSGLTIRMFITDSELDPSTINDNEIHYFTVGGNVGQIVADNTKYVYARTVVDDPTIQGTLITDTENIIDDDLISVRNSVEFLTVQLMKLSKRVTKQELKSIDHGVDYELFVRQFLDTTAHQHIQISAIHKHIATIWEELLLAEKFIQRHRVEYDTMREMIDNIRNTDTNAGLRADVELIKTDIVNILSNYANITGTIEEIQNDISTTGQKYDNLLNDEISPIRSKVYELMNKFATLNNALAALNVNYTSDQINEMFNDFITTVPTDMVNTVTAIRDDILAILDRSGSGNGDLSSSDLFYISSDTDVIDAIKNN
jgi:hypothetical protein